MGFYFDPFALAYVLLFYVEDVVAISTANVIRFEPKFGRNVLVLMDCSSVAAFR